ncbi:3'(2'),5'-bisphosphate nucleotidase [Mycoemilia scoparia]|uniref:3'(2'),5'-bisphosphate nucleotidase n=1 Tax=Mycoemilia scoparia TaxID=417184 RepID=A0A9W8A8U6_9FUNG|nr:3'(2'),5'-bisphosphate nucleotidase [Mycoemilia scoparia]
MSGYLSRERKVAIEAVEQASKVCKLVFKQLVEGETLTKGDKSPVTFADFSAQAIVNSILEKHFPNDPIVGEEDSKDLQGESGEKLRSKVVELTNLVISPSLSEDQILKAIDRGQYEGGKSGRFWTLDPIDGTKGFLRGEQYAVCLALIEDGKVKLGVLGCPNLPHDINNEHNTGRGSIFVAVKGRGAFRRPLGGSDEDETPIKASSITDLTKTKFCESVESGHTSQSDSATIANKLGITLPPVRMDSQCKYGCIANGDADIYLRLRVSATYVEKIWDHAAGSILVAEAGGRVSDTNGDELDFSQGRRLEKNVGVVAANASIYDKVIEAVKAQVSS